METIEIKPVKSWKAQVIEYFEDLGSGVKGSDF
jgi:hypothetical protein